MLDHLINGVVLGNLYALTSVGITQIYGVSGVVNFAHGSIYMVGAYVGWMAITWFQLPLIPALLLVAAGWFLVPLNVGGVTVDETWDVLGMRATGSHDLVLDNVRIPTDAFLQGIGPGRTCQMDSGAGERKMGSGAPTVGGIPSDAVPGDGAGWGLHIPAVYLGIAQAARQFALTYAQERRPNTLQGTIADVPQIQLLLGENEADLLAARSLLYTVARRWDEEADNRDGLKPLLGAAKVVSVNNAIAIVDRAMRVAGIAGLSRALPLERYYRDVRAGLSNPPMEDSALIGLAQHALREVE